MNYDALITKYAKQFAVPSLWIETTIRTESTDGAWPPTPAAEKAHNPNDGYGLMQVLYTTAKNLGYSGSPEGLFDPDTNILYGTKLLAQLKRSYGDNLERIYSAYNSGRPDLWETSAQVKANVERFMRNLKKSTERFVSALPTAVAVGPGIAAGLVFLILWQWKGRF